MNRLVFIGPVVLLLFVAIAKSLNIEEGYVEYSIEHEKKKENILVFVLSRREKFVEAEFVQVNQWYVLNNKDDSMKPVSVECQTCSIVPYELLKQSSRIRLDTLKEERFVAVIVLTGPNKIGLKYVETESGTIVYAQLLPLF